MGNGQVRAVPASPLQHIVWVGEECDLRQGELCFLLHASRKHLTQELNIWLPSHWWDVQPGAQKHVDIPRAYGL
jgi:hypothetical protein